METVAPATLSRTRLRNSAGICVRSDARGNSTSDAETAPAATCPSPGEWDSGVGPAGDAARRSGCDSDWLSIGLGRQPFRNPNILSLIQCARALIFHRPNSSGSETKPLIPFAPPLAFGHRVARTSALWLRLNCYQAGSGRKKHAMAAAPLAAVAVLANPHEDSQSGFDLCPPAELQVVSSMDWLSTMLMRPTQPADGREQAQPLRPLLGFNDPASWTPS